MFYILTKRQQRAKTTALLRGAIRIFTRSKNNARLSRIQIFAVCVKPRSRRLDRRRHRRACPEHQTEGGSYTRVDRQANSSTVNLPHATYYGSSSSDCASVRDTLWAAIKAELQQDIVMFVVQAETWATG